MAPHGGPSSNCLVGRAVAVVNNTRFHSAAVKTPSASGPEGTRPAGPSAMTSPRRPVRVSPKIERASNRICAAPPATKGVAAEVPLPTLSPDWEVWLWFAAHEAHESETRCGGKPGQVLTWPES